MTKKKGRPKTDQREGPPTGLVRPVPVPPELAAAAQEQKETPEEAERYSFPTVVRCPRCNSPNTTAYATKGRIQYRACQGAVCRYRFKAVGKAV